MGKDIGHIEAKEKKTLTHLPQSNPAFLDLWQVDPEKKSTSITALPEKLM